MPRWAWWLFVLVADGICIGVVAHLLHNHQHLAAQ